MVHVDIQGGMRLLGILFLRLISTLPSGSFLNTGIDTNVFDFFFFFNYIKGHQIPGLIKGFRGPEGASKSEV